VRRKEDEGGATAAVHLPDYAHLKRLFDFRRERTFAVNVFKTFAVNAQRLLHARNENFGGRMNAYQGGKSALSTCMNKGSLGFCTSRSHIDDLPWSSAQLAL
jgi:hypothetical protein